MATARSNSDDPLPVRSRESSTLPKPAMKTWPSRSAGPHNPSPPIQCPLLRLIPGDPRFAHAPLQWMDDTPPQVAPLQLSAALGSECATITLPWLGDNPIADEYFQFNTCDLASQYITFTLKSKSHTYTSLFLVTEFSARKGVITRAMVDGNGILAARFTVDFLLITPYHVNDQVATNKQQYVPRFIGHRGMGSSGAHAPHRLLENSLESFWAATVLNSHVKCVELDVQMTKDSKVVVYHDWFVRPRDGHGNTVHDYDSVKIPVYSLTFDQFDKLYIESYKHDKRLSDTQTQLDRIGDERGICRSVFDKRVRSLREVCELLPDDVGVLVELKYPAPDVQDDLGIAYPEKNEFVERVLDDLLLDNLLLDRRWTGSGEGRKIGLLSFDADICILLKAKQTRYPVYFSHCETEDKPCDEQDPRCIDLREGLRFVVSHDLDGVMMLNKLTETRREVVTEMVERGIPMITYGKSNCKVKVVEAQFNMGIRGVIADDIGVLVNSMTGDL